MANIYPFRGVRYNKAKVGDFNDVVTPPYDVISSDEQQWYFGKHPNSIIRLILPREDATSSATKYERAATTLNDWLDSGVLARDEEPSLYACEQEYVIDGMLKKRLGFTCLVRIEDYENKKVLPHENILAKPMDDRLNLLRSTRTNFDSVFGLYANGEAEEIIKPFLLREPDATAVDKAGVVCNLWKISDSTAIQAIVNLLENESILIADGHHRYAAALAYRNEMREKNGVNPDAPYEFVMMTMVSLEDKGLVVLPTHRLVKNLESFDSAAFIAKIAEYFDVTETPVSELADAVAAHSSELHVFGLNTSDGRSCVLKLKPEIKPEQVIETPGSDALKRLDVSVLHSMILDKILGISTKQLSAQSNLSYSRDSSETLKSVEQGECQMAFLMNSTRVDEVKAVAAAGDKMPQKSTFFYPKLLTGLIMRVME